MFYFSREKADYFVALIAIALILYIWISSLWFILLPWYNQEDSDHTAWIVYFIVLHVLVLMILWSYLAVSLTCPGWVPKNYYSTLIQVW